MKYVVVLFLTVFSITSALQAEPSKKVRVIYGYALSESVQHNCNFSINGLSKNEIIFVRRKIAEEYDARETYLQAKLDWDRVVREGGDICAIGRQWNQTQ
jgi:hypothetical protein